MPHSLNSSQAVFVPYCGLGLELIYAHRGNLHQWNVSLVQMVGFANVANIVCIVYILLMLFIKSAVLLQYLRLFSQLKLIVASGCGASLVRSAFAFELIKSEDMTYLLAIEYHWSLAEATSGIVCCSVPCIPRFYRHFVGHAKQSIQRFSKTSSTQSPSHSKTGAKKMPVLGRHDPYLELDDLKTSSTGSSEQQQSGMKKYLSDLERAM
ncbi:MAG: hypothetical protein Q9168_004074 [Polycauliona sp. 1 TL-2023]